MGVQLEHTALTTWPKYSTKRTGVLPHLSSLTCVQHTVVLPSYKHSRQADLPQ